MVEDHAKELLKISDIFVVDAYFSKFKFTEAVIASGFTFISKLTKNTKLKYPYLILEKKQENQECMMVLLINLI